MMLGEMELPSQPLFTVSEAVTGSAPFQIVFTSGTTSEPKGVVHTHRNVLASLRTIESEIAKYRRYERYVHPLRFLHTLPLSHVFGQFMGLWVPGILAAELHFSDQLEPGRMVALIRREKVSVLVSVPRLLAVIKAHLLIVFDTLGSDLDAATGLKAWQRWWRFRRVHRALGWKFWAVISGGAAMPAELETFWNRLGFALIQGYGMTETAALVTLNHPFKISKGSIGKVMPGREVKIGEDGEILVRGEMVAGATWQGGAMRQRESEWLATGDLASRDDAGDLRFLGRKSDVIVTAAGMNVHPADVEQAFAAQAGVRGCVVVPCELAGGIEAVAVLLFAGGDAEMQGAVEGANRGLSEFQRVRRVLRWPDAVFPYTSTGKLLRRTVRDWACGELAGRRVGVGGDTSSLLAAVAEVTSESVDAGGKAEDELRLTEDLHLDSLGRVQLQSLLERRMGAEVSDEAMARVETLGELRQLMGVGGPDVDSARGPVGVIAVQAEAEEHLYPKWPWSWPIWLARAAFVELVMRPLVWLLGAPTVSTVGVVGDDPMLVIANHGTAYDGALILYALPWRLRHRVAIAMSGEMLMDLRRGRNQGNALANLLAPVGYWLITALFNVFPLPRRNGFRESFAHAGAAMDRGYSVMIFPEGTRTRDGRMHAFRQGIGLLAQMSRVSVLPVGLVGIGALASTGARWFRSGRLAVRVGEAISFAETGSAEELTVRYESAVRALIGEPEFRAEE